jgi:hypothetical protein
MKLEVVILNLPKSKDLINNSKQKINKEFELIDKLFYKIKSVNSEINIKIKFDSKDISEIKNINKLLIDSNELVGKIALSNKIIKEYQTDINQIKTNKNFNSEWVGGKVPGELIDTEDGYRIRFDGQSRSFKYKNIINSDKLIGCVDKQDCKVKAEKYLYDYYNNLGKITNKYRYVSPDVIEIQLNQNKTFITNSKFLSLIEQYRIGFKHDKRYDRYYITYVESPKVNKLLTDLISNISKVKLSNGCDFDLREENLIESDNKLIGLEFVSKLNQDIINIESDLNKKTNPDGLPMYQWIKGKFVGTVFQRKDQNKWTVVVKKPDSGVITKTLSFDTTTKDSVYKEAIEIRNNLSDMYGLTTNKIKILDENKIEVKLSKDQIMITDYKFLNIVEKYNLFATKSSNEGSKYYASIEVGGVMYKYHKFITSWDMVDHIDRNPLNNCLSNLRETTHKENNNNRNKSESSGAIELGVTYSAKDDAYKARIKQDGKEYCKQFSVKKYGKDEALKLAIETRREFNRAFNCLNG